jgi:hypothetical protein
MAERALVLCDLLCFLVTKFGKTQLNMLKSAAVDFYNVDTIVVAKVRLLEDLSSLYITDKFPQIPKRRDGADRLKQEVDDIITALTFLHEHGLLSNLPRYVSHNSDNTPSVRLFDSDLRLLLARFDKMEEKLNYLGHRRQPSSQ